MKKNVTAINTGTINMSRTVFLGLTPAAVSAAYDKEPNNPLPPVPDDQVEITFLKKKEMIVKCLKQRKLQ